MLTVLGLGMILCFMYLIMSKRLSPLVALTLIPLLFALIAWLLGFYFDSLSHIQINEIGDMMIEGVKKLAPTGIMLLFAILYFAIMIDTGLFDPSVKFILKMVKGDPLKVRSWNHYPDVNCLFGWRWFYNLYDLCCGHAATL
jgi:H+/citrate symporter